MKIALKNNIYFLFFIYILSLIINLLFFNFILLKNNGYLVCHDSSEYITVAQSIYKNNSISNQDGEPTYYRVPGYSIFIAFIYKLFGINNKKFIYAQILLSSFIPILIFILSLILFPNNFLVAKVASILSVINIGFILHSGLVMSECLFLILFLLFLILFFKNNIYISGIILGLASLVRPVGHFLLVISIFLILINNLKFLKKIKYIFLLVLAWAFVVSPWLYRNYLLTNKITLHAMSGYHFLTYFASQVEAENSGISYSEAKNKLLGERLILPGTESLKDIQANKIAIKYLTKNYFVTLKYATINMLKTIFSLNSAYLLFIETKALPEYANNTSIILKIKRFLFPENTSFIFKIIIYLEIILLIVMLSGFLFSLLSVIYNRDFGNIIFKILLFILLFIFLTLGSGVARLRLPIEVFLIIFASNFYLNFFKNKFKHV
ncbi:MAG: dolichyl-phosphate-mannose-protein mannosyltransferase family protein [candidate division TM6 bacterium GW2011_GWF2_28_16]|nr:MAG: dolichyl-phosphate-mannose-protein mannosyltransferase family protein [candidate division TM6 bacterium GW2011_GWF2_28_16]